MTRHLPSLLRALALLLVASDAGAQATEFTNFAQWQSAGGSFTTITFAEYSKFTFITDQYQPLGAVFTDGNDFILNNPGFPQDGAGLEGNFADSISVSFATPQHAVGVHYPGLIHLDLYSNGNLLHSSTNFSTVTGFFAGVVSSVPFDSVTFSNWGTIPTAFIDNLYFGPGVPAPGALALLGATGLICRRRREAVR